MVILDKDKMIPEQLISKDALFKRVRITTIKKAIYEGVLSRWAKGKLCITKLIICQKDGNYKAVEDYMRKHRRVFNTKSIDTIEFL